MLSYRFKCCTHVQFSIWIDHYCKARTTVSWTTLHCTVCTSCKLLDIANTVWCEVHSGWFFAAGCIFPTLLTSSYGIFYLPPNGPTFSRQDKAGDRVEINLPSLDSSNFSTGELLQEIPDQRDSGGRSWPGKPGHCGGAGGVSEEHEKLLSIQEDRSVRYPTLTHIGVTSRSGSATVSWATPECFPEFEIALQKVDTPPSFSSCILAK